MLVRIVYDLNIAMAFIDGLRRGSVLPSTSTGLSGRWRVCLV